MKLECDVIRDLLPLYAEKLASPASSALVEQHLSECPACRAELEQMEKPVPVQPEPQPDAPLKNIRSSLNRRRLRTMLCSFAAALALAAVLLVVTNWVKLTKKWHPIVFIGLSAAVGVVFRFGGV